MRDVLIQPPLRLVLTWNGDQVCQAEVGWAGGFTEKDSLRESPYAGEAADFFRAYVRGEPSSPAGIPLAWKRVRSFAGEVLFALQRQVPHGEWISYSGLAGLCGAPGGARAVGRVMSGNPWPLLVPCHRVLRKDGGIGGFSSGIELKRCLLRIEGVFPGRE